MSSYGSRVYQVGWIRRNDAVRSFLTAAWLGWQIESNWADPLLFLGYSIARPITGVLILVVMYNVITDGATSEPIFAYIYNRRETGSTNRYVLEFLPARVDGNREESSCVRVDKGSVRPPWAVLHVGLNP